MNNTIIQLLILAGVALFLIFRLKNVLWTRDGFEPKVKDSINMLISIIEIKLRFILK